MDKLPLELVVQIVHLLPPGYIWLLRSLSKSWERALKSPTTTAGHDVDSVRSIYTSKPVGCEVLLSNNVEHGLICIEDHRLAWIERTTTDLSISVRDLLAKTTANYTMSKSNIANALILCDFVAVVASNMLHMVPSGRRRPLPGFHVVAACDHRQKIAVLCNVDQSDPHELWVYDNASDSWTRIDILQWLQTQYYSWQGVTLDRGIRVVSAHTVDERHHVPGENMVYTINVWTLEEQRTIIYSHSRLLVLPPSVTSVRSCGHHILSAGLNMFLTDHWVTEPYPVRSARSYPATFSSTDLGIETPRGFLKPNWTARETIQNLQSLVNVHYLISVYCIGETSGPITKMYVFSLDRQGPILSDSTWEEKDEE